MKNIQSASLYFKEGSSDKEYHAQILESEKGFLVNFQYGRRGAALQTGTKTSSPVTKPEAEKIFNKLVKEKTSKGYTPSETGQTFSGTEYTTKKSNIAVQLSNPITTESELESYLKDDSMLAQEKYDGERRAAEKNTATVGINRKGLEVQLPEKTANSIITKGIFDGEIIGEHLYLFDILKLESKDLTKLPTTERIKTLESVKFGSNVTIVKTAYTEAEKRSLLKAVQDKGGEGIIFKKKSAPYNSGRPASGGNSIKYKLYKTATFIVSSITKAKRSVGLTVLDQNTEVEVGKVTIPPNFSVPAVGALVEVRYLYANKGGAVYQPVYLGERSDLDKESATIDQLEYKQPA